MKFRELINTLKDLIRIEKVFTEQNDGPQSAQVLGPRGKAFGVRQPLLSILVLPLVEEGRAGERW